MTQSYDNQIECRKACRRDEHNKIVSGIRVSAESVEEDEKDTGKEDNEEEDDDDEEERVKANGVRTTVCEGEKR